MPRNSSHFKPLTANSNVLDFTLAKDLSMGDLSKVKGLKTPLKHCSLFGDCHLGFNIFLCICPTNFNM